MISLREAVQTLFALPQHGAVDALSFGLMQHQLNVKFFCDKAMELKRAYSNAPSLCDVMLWCLQAAYLPCCVGRSFNRQQQSTKQML